MFPIVSGKLLMNCFPKYLLFCFMSAIHLLLSLCLTVFSGGGLAIIICFAVSKQHKVIAHQHDFFFNLKQVLQYYLLTVVLSLLHLSFTKCRKLLQFCSTDPTHELITVSLCCNIRVTSELVKHVTLILSWTIHLWRNQIRRDVWKPLIITGWGSHFSFHYIACLETKTSLSIEKRTYGSWSTVQLLFFSAQVRPCSQCVGYVCLLWLFTHWPEFLHSLWNSHRFFHGFCLTIFSRLLQCFVFWLSSAFTVFLYLFINMFGYNTLLTTSFFSNYLLWLTLFVSRLQSFPGFCSLETKTISSFIKP